MLKWFKRWLKKRRRIKEAVCLGNVRTWNKAKERS